MLYYFMEDRKKLLQKEQEAGPVPLPTDEKESFEAWFGNYDQEVMNDDGELMVGLKDFARAAWNAAKAGEVRKIGHGLSDVCEIHNPTLVRDCPCTSFEEKITLPKIPEPTTNYVDLDKYNLYWREYQLTGALMTIEELKARVEREYTLVEQLKAEVEQLKKENAVRAELARLGKW